MWIYERQETVGSDTRLYFTKGQMDRNTIVVGVPTEQQIQDMIDAWEAEDAATIIEVV